jgi:hypothetical protein
MSLDVTSLSIEPGDQTLYRKRLTQHYREAMNAVGSPDRETKAEDEGSLKTMIATLTYPTAISPAGIR